MEQNRHKIPKDANLKDFINLERYLNKKPAIFNKFYKTNLIEIVDILPPINEEQKQKYESGQMNFIKKKKPYKVQEEQKSYEEELLKNVTLAYRHESDRLNQDLEINQYSFTGLLGRGAHSIVRLCKSNDPEEMNQLYVNFSLTKACKILWFDKIRKKYFIKPKQLFGMINNEIILLKEMRHPNIISFKEAIYLKEKQRLFLILEYCSKGPISKLVNNNLTLEDRQWWQIAKQYFRQFIQGIKFMHDHNILHRDIKPENLLINDKNELKIIDFNVSKKIQNNQKIKITNKFIGTKGYAAPQLILGLEKEKENDGKKIDVWAMGITFIEIIQRKHPYPVKTLPELVQVLQNYGKQAVNKIPKNERNQDEEKRQNMGMVEKLYINEQYPEHLKDLLGKMLHFQNQKRISIQQIIAHPWFSNTK